MKHIIAILLSLISIFSCAQTLLPNPSNVTVATINAALGGAIAASGTNSYSGSLTGVTSYTNFAADIQFTNANTSTSCTFNLSGSVGAKSLKKYSNGSLTDLAVGDISAGSRIRFYYNGTYLVMGTTIGGASNSAMANEVTKSNGTNIVGTGIYSHSAGSLDSVKIVSTITAGIGNATVLKSFGDSFTFGLNTASPYDSAYNRRLARALSLPLTNYGVSSTKIHDALTSQYININYPHTSLTTLMSGFNDLTVDVTLPANRPYVSEIMNGYKSSFVNQFGTAPVNVSSGAVTRTGSWGTNWDARANLGGKTSTAIYTQTQGDKVTYTFTDSTVCVQMLGSASYQIKIDGSTVTTGHLSGASVSGVDVSVIVNHLTYASHTLELSKTDATSNFLFVDYICHLVPVGTPMVFFEIPYLNPPHNNASKTYRDFVNPVIDSLYAQLIKFGRPLSLAKSNKYYSHIGVSSDSTHPNNTGHYQIFKAGLEAINGRSSTPGTIDRRTDGRFYFSEKGLSLPLNLSPSLQQIISNGSTLNAPNKISGSNKGLSLTDFSAINLGGTDSTMLIVQDEVDVKGTLFVKGPSANITVGSRDNSGNFIFYSSGGILRWYDASHTRDFINSDQNFRTAFFNNNLGTGTFAPTATVHIGGNHSAILNHVPLKIENGALTASPEKYAFENLGMEIYWTDSALVRSPFVRKSTFSASSSITPSAQAIGRNLVAADNGTIIVTSNSSPISITIPTGLTSGFMCRVAQGSTGAVTVSGAGGTTVVGGTAGTSVTANAGDIVEVYCTGSNTYLINKH